MRLCLQPAARPNTIQIPLGACRELAPSKQESTTYEPSLVCKLLILGCRLLIPDRLLDIQLQQICGIVAWTALVVGPNALESSRLKVEAVDERIN